MNEKCKIYIMQNNRARVFTCDSEIISAAERTMKAQPFIEDEGLLCFECSLERLLQFVFLLQVEKC